MQSAPDLTEVLRLARRRIRRFAVADAVDDLVQDAMRKIVACPTTSTREATPALVVAVARNLAIDAARRASRQAAFISDLAFRVECPCLTECVQEEDLLLTQLLMAMPPLYRDTFMLNRLEGYTYVEIAERLGISVKTVEYRMSRALALCRKALSEP